MVVGGVSLRIVEGIVAKILLQKGQKAAQCVHARANECVICTFSPYHVSVDSSVSFHVYLLIHS